MLFKYFETSWKCTTQEKINWKKNNIQVNQIDKNSQLNHYVVIFSRKRIREQQCFFTTVGNIVNNSSWSDKKHKHQPCMY